MNSLRKRFQHDSDAIGNVGHSGKLCLQFFTRGSGGGKPVRFRAATGLLVVFLGTRQL